MTRSRSSFDEPLPSSSSFVRSVSPLHFSPYSHHHSHAKHTREQDISRLLDPAYSSKANAHPSASVYVDHDGDAHDPDFRQFPVQPSASSSKRRTLSPSRYGGYTRPAWEVYGDEDALEDDEEDVEDDNASFFSASRLSYPASTPRRSSSHLQPIQRRIRGDSYATSTSYSSYSRHNAYPTATSSSSHYDPSPPTSFNSHLTPLDDSESPFEDEKKEKRTSLLIGCGRKRRASKAASEGEEEKQQKYRTSAFVSNPSDHHRSSSLSHDEEKEPQSELHQVSSSQRQAEWTPTCTQSLQRQWQAISLRFRFGLFRAQKRMQRRVHSIF